MIDKLLVHPATKSQIAEFLKSPSHGLLISGPEGIGKLTLAQYLTNDLTGNQPGSIVVISREEGKKDIPIESIRSLKRQFALRSVSKQPISRVAIIEDADLLNTQAQNALLKLLEEPAEGSMIMLTTAWPSRLLPTVKSRLQTITARKASLKQAREFFGGADIDSAWSLSGGAPALLKSLLESDDHALKAAIGQAKSFLAQDKYQRLATLNSLAQDKESLGQFLSALKKVVKALLKSSVKSSRPTAKRLLKSLGLIMQLSAAHEANVAAKLVVLRLQADLPI